MNKKNKQLILGLIDKGTWKHSWHLLKNKLGYVDWMNKKNLIKCREIATQMANEGMNLMHLAGQVNAILTTEICEIEIQEKIDTLPEKETL